MWHAGAGGVGLIACQWAKALGLVVIATAGGPDKCALALAHGAAHAIDYHREDVVARVRALTGGAGVEVVYDPVGKDTWERSLDCLAPFGLMVSFGNASGAPPLVDLGVLMRKGSLYVSRPTLGTHTASHAQVQELAGALFARVASGDVVIDAPRTYPLADAARAHAELESRATTGASVLVPCEIAGARSSRREGDATEASEQHVERDVVVAALGHDQIGPPLGRLDMLDVHRAHRRVVLVAHRLERAATLLEVAADAAHQPDVGVGVDEDLDVHLIAQRGLGEHEDALDDDHRARLDASRARRARVLREVVDRDLDRLALA